MAIVRWDPLRSMLNLQERINRVFDESMAQSNDVEDDALCAWRPAADIFETTDAIVLKAELPGVSKENVTLEIKDNVLTIKGERTVDTGQEF
ncbi:Hsp20/alpha crystallin family protein [Thermodesulfobacteriota bacterium]